MRPYGSNCQYLNLSQLRAWFSFLNVLSQMSLYIIGKVIFMRVALGSLQHYSRLKKWFCLDGPIHSWHADVMKCSAKTHWSLGRVGGGRRLRINFMWNGRIASWGRKMETGLSEWDCYMHVQYRSKFTHNHCAHACAQYVLHILAAYILSSHFQTLLIFNTVSVVLPQVVLLAVPIKSS